MCRLTTAVLFVLVTLVVVACTPAVEVEPGQNDSLQVLNTATAAPTIQVPELSVTDELETAYPPPPLPTVDPLLLEPPEIMIPTLPFIPNPTLPPTPEVTPIPTIVAGFDVPEPAPFWIYGLRDNTVWRMDSQRLQEEVLFDAMELLGQPLVANYDFPVDEFIPGPSISPSPSNNKVAITTVRQAPETQDGFEIDLSVFDIASGQMTNLGPGIMKAWAPDGEKLAFRRDGALWMAQVNSGEVVRIVDAPEISYRFRYVTWSPDGQKIAYTLGEGYQDFPTVWLVEAVAGAEPQALATNPDWISAVRLQFAPDGQHLYFVTTEDDRSRPLGKRINLVALSLDTKELRQLAAGMVIYNFVLSPDGQWILFHGFQEFVPGDLTGPRDLWLVRLSDGSLHRLTYGMTVYLGGWDANSSQVMAIDNDARNNIVVLSLADLTVKRITLDPALQFFIPR